MPTEPKDKSKDVIDKEALDALNFRNNILAKLQGKKNRTNLVTDTKKNNKKGPPVIRGLGRLGEHKKAYKKRNTRTA
jgi:hypothetical protein|tara:strand:- start:29518 stop:29748 length:231 start_codon:yes stop_codon:yes gene_type:complete